MTISDDFKLYILSHLYFIHDFTYKALNDFYSKKINELFYGKTDKNRIVVLGAFDTWPYMDFICRILARDNYIALTSRFLYHKLNDKIIKFPTTEISQLASTDLSMKRLLKKIIGSSLLAVINYSVSAAHYIETDWCENEPDLDYIGIAHVRDTSRVKNCENLEVKELDNGMSFYSICKALENKKKDWNAWDCIKVNGFCPFKQQDISKNVLEYYFKKDKELKLIAYNNIDDLTELIKKEIHGKIEELSNEHLEEFNNYFSNFKLNEKEIDTLLVAKGLDFLIFLKNCLIIFGDFINNIGLKMLELFELINDIIENIPSSEKDTYIEYNLNQFEADHKDEVKMLRDIFTGGNNQLLDFISGLSGLRIDINKNYGNWIINFLIKNDFIKESNAFWELTEKTEELFSNLNINPLIDKYIIIKLESLS
jgi:hypothetical protein